MFRKMIPLAFTVSALALAGCTDGDAENAGEDIDAAIEDVTGEETDTFEEAGEEVDDEPSRH
ncbi:hypothetical protein [uncultured Maricaulis sp.]|uniref:hypothetical protein n=1 Tax=uncultured Maricaulis sp. TaxID=174710 RepID=UPI00260C8D1A|nr:hypothetical protein [uncultured Maricaulis sp.]